MSPLAIACNVNTGSTRMKANRTWNPCLGGIRQITLPPPNPPRQLTSTPTPTPTPPPPPPRPPNPHYATPQPPLTDPSLPYPYSCYRIPCRGSALKGSVDCQLYDGGEREALLVFAARCNTGAGGGCVFFQRSLRQNFVSSSRHLGHGPGHNREGKDDFVFVPVVFFSRAVVLLTTPN